MFEAGEEARPVEAAWDVSPDTNGVEDSPIFEGGRKGPTIAPAPALEAAGDPAAVTVADAEALELLASVLRVVAAASPDSDEPTVRTGALVPEVLASGESDGVSTDSVESVAVPAPADTLVAMSNGGVAPSVGDNAGTTMLAGALGVTGAVVAEEATIAASAPTPAAEVISSATSVSTDDDGEGTVGTEELFGVANVSDETEAGLLGVDPGAADVVGMTASADSGPGSSTGIGSRAEMPSPLSTGPTPGMSG